MTSWKRTPRCTRMMIRSTGENRARLTSLPSQQTESLDPPNFGGFLAKTAKLEKTLIFGLSGNSTSHTLPKIWKILCVNFVFHSVLITLGLLPPLLFFSWYMYPNLFIWLGPYHKVSGWLAGGQGCVRFFLCFKEGGQAFFAAVRGERFFACQTLFLQARTT